jgi:competence protein ComEA
MTMRDNPETRELSRLLWSLLLAGVVASAGVFVASRSSTAPSRLQTGAEGALYVQMQAPGVGVAVYRMPSGARLRDLFHAARIPLPRDMDGMESLVPGRAVAVEAEGGVSLSWMSGDQMVALGVSIPLNECGLQDLVAIPGIGESTAMKILKVRVERGRYDSFNELANLSGVGEKTLTALRQYGRL